MPNPVKPQKVSSDTAKEAAKKKEKQQKAIASVMDDSLLRRLLAREQKRCERADKSVIDLWWERGEDVLSVRRAANPKDSDGRAGYGTRGVALLALAVGLEPRAFDRAADFVAMFEEDRDKQTEFFKKTKEKTEFDLSWTHVETLLKVVSPSHKDLTDPLYHELLELAAQHHLSSRAFEKELDKKFRMNRDRKRRIDQTSALKQLERSLDSAIEACKRTLDLAVETLGDNPSEVIDPQAVSTLGRQVSSKMNTLIQTLTEGEVSLNQRLGELARYVRTLRDDAPAAEEETDVPSR